MKKDLASDESRDEVAARSSLIALVNDGGENFSISEIGNGLSGKSFATFQSAGDFLQALQRRMIFDAVLICFSGGLKKDDLLKIQEMAGGPVIFLFERDRSDELLKKVISLSPDVGGVDFVVSPFDSKEIDLRMAFLIRKFNERAEAKTLKWGKYSFLMRNCTVVRDEETIHLKPREFFVALELFRNKGRILPRERLMQLLWSTSNGVGSRTLDVCMSNIRLKLGLKSGSGLSLQAIYRQGYRLIQEEITRSEYAMRPGKY